MEFGRPRWMLGIGALRTGPACTHLVLGKRPMDFSHQTHTTRWVYVQAVCVQCVFACM